MKAKNKKSLEETLNSVGSRFCTIVYETTKSSGRFCAKVMSVGSSYVTIDDVNTSQVRRINLNSIREVRSGSQMWAV